MRPRRRDTPRSATGQNSGKVPGQALAARVRWRESGDGWAADAGAAGRDQNSVLQEPTACGAVDSGGGALRDAEELVIMGTSAACTAASRVQRPTMAAP